MARPLPCSLPRVLCPCTTTPTTTMPLECTTVHCPVQSPNSLPKRSFHALHHLPLHTARHCLMPSPALHHLSLHTARHCLMPSPALHHRRGLSEQQEVEQFFLSYGAFIKGYHEGYWTGLSSTAGTWPKFTWMDFLVPPPVNGSSYVHWAPKEPNNEYAPETCGLANSTVAFGGAWGWQDSYCYRWGWGGRGDVLGTS